MSKGYHIIDSQQISSEKKISFVRIKIDDYRQLLSTVLASLEDRTWISTFIKDYLRASFERRLDGTLKKLTPIFSNISNPKLLHDTGEKVVSESARMTVVQTYGYSNIPLAELFKQQIDGNPGFDFYSENCEELYILFGEAKYLANSNAYNSALKQILEFRDGEEQKLIVDLADLDKFCNERSIEKANNKECGFIAAFKCTEIQTDQLIKNIQENDSYKALMDSKELILIAVEI